MAQPVTFGSWGARLSSRQRSRPRPVLRGGGLRFGLRFGLPLRGWWDAQRWAVPVLRARQRIGQGPAAGGCFPGGVRPVTGDGDSEGGAAVRAGHQLMQRQGRRVLGWAPYAQRLSAAGAAEPGSVTLAAVPPQG